MHPPILHVDPAAPQVREHARDARAGHLAGRRGRGDGRRDAVDDQQRRGQEAAADPEHARQQPDAAAQQHDHQRVDRQIGDGEVDVHSGPRPTRLAAATLEAGGERQGRARGGRARPATRWRQSSASRRLPPRTGSSSPSVGPRSKRPASRWIPPHAPSPASSALRADGSDRMGDPHLPVGEALDRPLPITPAWP